MIEPMKTYPYNRASIEGRRLFKLLDVQFNKGTLSTQHEGKTFESYTVPSVMQCRANKTRFLFSSNHSGIKRPLVHVEADVETAWGEFTKDISMLDFTHTRGQELPLTYVQPIDDDTMKLLIDAGLYRDKQFELLISKLMQDEMFDAEADMTVAYLDIGRESEGETIPVLLVDPVNVVHEHNDPSEYTTLQTLLKRSAKLAIELRKEGVKTDELVATPEYEDDREFIIEDTFEDVIEKHEREKEVEVDTGKFAVSSELLDAEIDVTDELKGSLPFNHTSEDDRIRELKEREREEERRASESFREKVASLGKDADISQMKDEPKVKSNNESIQRQNVDMSKFNDYQDLDDYEIEDDGPEL